MDPGGVAPADGRLHQARRDADRPVDDDKYACLSSPSLSASAPAAGDEEALLALVKLRSIDVERLRQQIRSFQSQLEVAVVKLQDAQSKLACLRSHAASSSFSPLPQLFHSQGGEQVSSRGNEGFRPQRQSAAAEPQPHFRPPLIIPAVRPMPTPPTSADGRMTGPAGRSEASTSVSSSASAKASSSTSEASTRAARPFPRQADDAAQRGKRCASDSPSPERDKAMKKSSKRKVEREHRDLISCVGQSPLATTIRIKSGTLIPSQHKRKMRCLEINPLDDQLFATSSLNGVVNLWKLGPSGCTASLVSSTDCLSPVQRRWPEDMAWHPHGNRLFAAYTADDSDAQISVLDLNPSQRRASFLPGRPHAKGIINSICFMPGDACCSFATGGSDHAVVLWTVMSSKGSTDEWKAQVVHRNLHSSAVMGVAGLPQKKLVLSVGVDKRVLGFDLGAGRPSFKQQMESKCLGVLTNPVDFNLFMVQTGAPGKQLRLFDIRVAKREVLWLGWKQESSDSQSALVSQDWSSSGLYLSSGSADPCIHVFDIRSASHAPALSLPAHCKRVFKAAWHPARPLLVSISSDLNLGLHPIIF